MAKRGDITRLLKSDANRLIGNLEELSANYTGEASATALKELDALLLRLRAWQRR